MSGPRDERISPSQASSTTTARYRVHPLGDLRDALAVLQYTGGTTGLPKGAMLTHANLTAACAQYMRDDAGRPALVARTRQGARRSCVLPLFHIYALSPPCCSACASARQLVLHPRFDVDAVVKDLAEKKITVFPGVPTMYTAMPEHPGRRQVDLCVAQVLRLGRRAAAGRGASSVSRADRLPR